MGIAVFRRFLEGINYDLVAFSDGLFAYYLYLDISQIDSLSKSDIFQLSKEVNSIEREYLFFFFRKITFDSNGNYYNFNTFYNVLTQNDELFYTMHGEPVIDDFSLNGIWSNSSEYLYFSQHIFLSENACTIGYLKSNTNNPISKDSFSSDYIITELATIEWLSKLNVIKLTFSFDNKRIDLLIEVMSSDEIKVSGYDIINGVYTKHE